MNQILPLALNNSFSWPPISHRSEFRISWSEKLDSLSRKCYQWETLQEITISFSSAFIFCSSSTTTYNLHDKTNDLLKHHPQLRTKEHIKIHPHNRKHGSELEIFQLWWLLLNTVWQFVHPHIYMVHMCLTVETNGWLWPIN